VDRHLTCGELSEESGEFDILSILSFGNSRLDIGAVGHHPEVVQELLALCFKGRVHELWKLENLARFNGKKVLYVILRIDF
jgi:hypothetical protein